MNSSAPVVVAFEGGGTRSSVWVAAAEGSTRPRCKAQVGPSNFRTVGWVGLGDLLAKALLGLGNGRPESIAATAMGLAGAGSPGDREAARAQVRSAGLRGPLWIGTDVALALVGAFEGGPGLLVVAGTGSIVMGQGASGRRSRAGGWGAALGDEGSGYALGRGALQRLVAVIDGVDRPSRISRQIAGSSRRAPEDQVRWIRECASEVSQVAALARPLLKLAAAGDREARAVVAQGVQALTAQVVAARRALGRNGPSDVMLTGSLPRKSVYYRNRLTLALENAGFTVGVAPEDVALRGAVHVARAVARGDSVDEF